MKKIIFFEERDFKGRRFESSQDCMNMASNLSRCNSIRVEGGAWVIYERPDHKGNMYIMEPGEYPEYQRWMGYNDHIGSCRSIRGQNSSNFRMTMYQHDDFGGQTMELTEDCSHLHDRFSMREVRSVRVHDGAWVAYEEPHYRGRQYLLEKGDYRKCSEYGAMSPTMQSVRCIRRF
ncbi:gamma-crystallin S-like [Petromyzon marinus]|uniref:Gamma-crystallin S-like n=1 Tax=Petromyzon marinus TaxID=7757 RepID=A0AAJ7WQ22_PETMA|nr:gamma-crystallin S-like [Petromyzon marinus]XP_032804579.1 gamma-crystallin S-like [Petromyzon marinus]